MSVEPTSQVCAGPACRSTSSTPVSVPWSLGCWSSCRSSVYEVKCRLLRGGFRSAVSLWAREAGSDSRTSSSPLFFGVVCSSLESDLLIQRPQLPGCFCHSLRKQHPCLGLHVPVSMLCLLQEGEGWCFVVVVRFLKV